MLSSPSYLPARRAILLRKLHSEGLSTRLGRGEIVASDDPALYAGSVVLYRKPFSLQLEPGKNLYAVWNTGASVVAGDVRELEKREAHFCAVGAEMPGFSTSDCDICQKALQYVVKMLEATLTGPRVKTKYKKQRDLPKGYLNALHTGEVTPQQAYEDYGIPIADDLLGRSEGNRF